MLNLWAGVDTIAAGALSGAMSLRHASNMEQVYGSGYLNGGVEQGGVWNVAYRRLTAGLYASLAA